MGPSIENNGAFAFKFQPVAIEFPEVIDKAALAIEKHSYGVWVFVLAVYADGAAATTFQSEKAELAPAQGLGDFANTVQVAGSAENQLPQTKQKLSRPWRIGGYGICEKTVLFSHQFVL
jgi:hypothetical protein